MKDKLPRLGLFPQTAGMSNGYHIIIGGCNIVELLATVGNPLYVFKETTLRNKCLEYRHKFSKRYPNTQVIYACKGSNSAILSSLLEEGDLGLNVVSDRDVSIARSATFPSERSTSMTATTSGKSSML